jgi:hypothetical protein
VRDKPSRPTLAAALLVATVAFLIYRATLLPGFDFGDTPSFQVMSGEAVITPRDGYPLYFAIGRLFTLVEHDRAHAMNLASAVEGAVASGLLVVVGAEISGSVAAAAAAALLFAGSYTFWSQSIIAEVYALHACFLALTLWLLFRWEHDPTFRNLALFFGAYALGFGNHLSMVLLAPGYTLFLLMRAPDGWRSMFRPRVVALATLLACAGALQYAWNLHTLWLQPGPPPTLASAMASFWFDVTKSDWRDTMVLRVPKAIYLDRLRMYVFDVRQQFSWVGPLLAVVGLWQLFRTVPRRAWLLLLLFVVNFGFAFSYDVGDTHVFFLPSHLLIALLIAPALAWLDGLVSARGLVMMLALLFAGARIYRDYPALDRSGDTRPTDLVRAITTGVDDQHAILIEDLNWQVENGLTYFSRRVDPEVAVAHASDVLLYAPALVVDNLAIDRRVVVTARARAMLDRAYGPLFDMRPDPAVALRTLTDVVKDLPAGTRYVLAVLKPAQESPIDEQDLRGAVSSLTAGRVASIGSDGYAAIGGTVGNAPSLLVSASDDPFSTSAAIDGLTVAVRMESWLGSDTIRRMGFGHVIAGRRHTLIVERGISFVAFDAAGRPLRTAYASGIFAPEPRYVIQGMLSLR